MNEVALFFLYPSFGGGTTSFTVHLYEGFKRAGFKPSIYRVKERGEDVWRKFSKFDGVTYQNVTLDHAKSIVNNTPSILTAPCHSKNLPWAPNTIPELVGRGMRVVIHDPNEFKVYDHLEAVKGLKVPPPFCIRPTMKQFFSNAVFIPHPFVRAYDNTIVENWHKRPLHAVSIARVTFVKRTELILEANRKLPKKKQVKLYGSENRLYTRHKLTKMFPEYQQGNTGFPMGWGTAAKVCTQARYAVDFTHFPDDGGGGQYAQYEAWDAGTVNIMHEDWFRYKGEMSRGINCVAAESAQHLVSILKSEPREQDEAMMFNGFESLKKHDAKTIARRYWKELNK